MSAHESRALKQTTGILAFAAATVIAIAVTAFIAIGAAGAIEGMELVPTEASMNFAIASVFTSGLMGLAFRRN
jgi:hypothetical protein